MLYYLFDLDETLIIHPTDIKLMYNVYPNKLLKRLLKNMIGKKYIYTNATYGHADILLNKLDISKQFKKIYARDTIPYMKPYVESYKFIEQDIRKKYNDRNKYYFFDDRLENLQTAKSRGWYTIWVNINFLDKPYYVDYAFPNIHTGVMYFLLEN